jgi:chromosome segregation ATPase
LFGGEGAVQLTESAEARLARVETALNTLIGEVSKLRQSMDTVGDRITRLEEATKDAVPQVWKLRERVAQLERETAEMRINLEELRHDWEERQRVTGSRLWEVVRMALGPLLGAVAGWVAATFRRGLGG